MAKASVKSVKPVSKTRTKRAKSETLRTKRREAGAKEGQPKSLVPHRFAKGNPGKPKGTKNKLGVRLKEAILEAAEKSGRDGKGKDGAVGYLVWLSRAEPAVFGRMLEKVMPLQVEVADKTDRSLTASEAVARLEERNLPVPPALRSLAEGVAAAVHERQEADYDAELNGEGYEGADRSDLLDEVEDEEDPEPDEADTDVDEAA